MPPTCDKVTPAEQLSTAADHAGRRRGRGAGAALSRLVFGCFGWRAEPAAEPLPPKCLILADPHTSSLDYFWFNLFRKATGLECHWVAKKQLFRFPLGCINRAMGGIPVDRAGGHGAVPAFAKLFEDRERLALVIAPSGALQYRDHWKTGFYYIAREADVPVVCSYVDYKRKAIGIAPGVVHLTGDVSRDMAELRRIYDGVNPQGRNPKRQNPVRLLIEDNSLAVKSPSRPHACADTIPSIVSDGTKGNPLIASSAWSR